MSSELAWVKILLVDDDPLNLKALSVALEADDRELVLAASGDTALRRILADEFAVIMLDVHMPGLDGFETAALIRSRERSRDTPIIFLTGSTGGDTHVRRGYSLGAVDYLLKPVDVDVLRSKVAAFVELYKKTELVKRQAEELAAANAQIERDRATLEAVMAGMTDGLVLLDRTGHVAYCNTTAGTFFGINPTLVLGLHADEFFEAVRTCYANPEIVARRRADAYRRVAERPRFEASLVRPQPRDLQIQLFPVSDAAGSQGGTALLLHDVTAERDLARTKDDLMAMVSHELRSPVTSIVGFAKLLLGSDCSGPERTEFLQLIADEGSRLTALVDEFLDLQRLERRRDSLRTAPEVLAELVEHAIATVGPDSRRPITPQLDASLPPVLADGMRIHQVLVNLLTNARKYSPGGGAIEVAAHVSGNFVEISIRDQGLGIPSEALPRLFEQFYRVHRHEESEITGTGLGLTICRQIVEAHGGRIWVESDGPGQGSTFAFTLPIAVEQPTGPPVPPQEATSR
ncbi:MAG: response regulator [Chloroflexi bacterium]|nr:response regulator [Chloroflexota bacterium]